MEYRVIGWTRVFDGRFTTVSDKHPLFHREKPLFAAFFNAFSVYAGECPGCAQSRSERAMPIKSRKVYTKNT